MTKVAPLLSFVTSPEGDTVNIHANKEGIELLQKSLSNMLQKLEKGVCDHDHLFTQDWGSNELTTSMLKSERTDNSKQVHHVKIHSWTEEWRVKHEL